MTMISARSSRKNGMSSPLPMKDGIIDWAMYLPTETSAPLNMPI